MYPRESLRYYIVPPKEKDRKSYRITAYVVEGRKRTYTEVPEDIKAALLNLNNALKSSFIDKDTIERQLKELIKVEYARNNVQVKAYASRQLEGDNLKALDAYSSNYIANSRAKDKKTYLQSMSKFLESLGDLSIYTSSPIEIEKRLIERHGKEDAIRGVSYLNSLLSFIARKDKNGNDVRLVPPQIVKKKVDYVTEAEFKSLLRYIKSEELKSLAKTLFATGMRMGEALAITVDNIIDDCLEIEAQVDRDGELVPPKRGSVGRVLILPQYVDDVVRWAEVEDKLKYRFDLYEELRSACEQAFRNQKTKKQISPHDLRHSHAIYLLSKGHTLTQVAYNLRNSEAVCRKYYAGFSHNESTLDLMRKMLRKGGG